MGNINGYGGKGRREKGGAVREGRGVKVDMVSGQWTRKLGKKG